MMPTFGLTQYFLGAVVLTCMFKVKITSIEKQNAFGWEFLNNEKRNYLKSDMTNGFIDKLHRA